MSVISLVSMKGGVGKTSMTANLACAMAAKLGAGRVSVLDLDPQDALRWHFGLHHLQTPGVCHQSLGDANWRSIAVKSEFGVVCLPYGNADEEERQGFESLLTAQPNWVGSQLERYGLTKDAVVLIDTPPGPSIYLQQACACSDLILIVLLADAASYATIPAMESWLGEIPKPTAFYLLNQVDRSEALNRDTSAFLREQLRTRICPIDIHKDETMGEALAFQHPVLEYEPHAQASLDLARMATWVINALNQ